MTGRTSTVQNLGCGLHAWPVRIVRFLLGAILQRSVWANHAASQGRIRAGKCGRCVDPQLHHAPLVRSGLHIIMGRYKLVHERAHCAANGVGRIVAVSQITSVRDLKACGECEITVREHGALVAGEQGASRIGIHIVARQAMSVEDGLYVPRIVKYLGRARHGRDGTGRTLERQPGRHSRRRAGPILVTANAGGDFTGHDREKAQHALHGQVIGVQSHQLKAAKRRCQHVDRSIRLHRHCAQHTVQRIGTAAADRIHGPREVDGLGQVFQYEQFLDRAGSNTLHVSPEVDIGHDQLAAGLRQIRLRRNHGLPQSGAYRSRLVQPAPVPGQLRRQPIEFPGSAPSIHQQKACFFSHEKGVFRQRIGITELASLVDHALGARVVRPQIRANQGYSALVLGLPVPWRIDHHDLVRARHGFGIQIHVPGQQVAVEGHLPGAIGIHDPQMVKILTRPVHVFPSRVQDTTVRQDPGRVVLFDIGGEQLDIPAASVTAVQGGHLRVPARHPSPGARGAEDDVTIRQIRGLQIVERTVRQLSQSGPIYIDLVEMKRIRAAPAIGEEDLAAVIMYLRITHSPLWIGHETCHPAVLEIQFTQIACSAIDLVIHVRDGVPDVLVPMGPLELTYSKDNLLNPVQGLGGLRKIRADRACQTQTGHSRRQDREREKTFCTLLKFPRETVVLFVCHSQKNLPVRTRSTTAGLDLSLDQYNRGACGMQMPG